MNVNRNNTGDFYRNRSNNTSGTNGLCTPTLAAAVSDLNQQQRLLGGPSLFSVSDRIAALAAGIGAARNTCKDGGAAAAAAAALSSLGGKTGDGYSLDGTNDLLKNALSDGQLTKPVIDILDQTKNVHDAAAIANVFPPIAKPPSSLVATATAAAYVESGESAPAAVTAGLDSDELKRQQRLEQNKMSARRSRKRKKIILDELQATVEQLTAENEQLEKENKRLEEELERRKKIKESGKGLGPESTSVSSATSFAVPHSFDCGLAAGTSMATAGPPTTSIGVVPSAIPVANRSLLVSQLATIMSGQAAPGLCPQKALGTPTTAGTTLTANSIISSIATPAPRPSQLYLSRPTVNTNANTSTSQSAAAQEQLHRSILSMYQEQERKNANKKRLLGD